MEEDAEILVTDWFRRIRESQRTHYECGSRLSRLHLLLGIPTIILTVVVATAVFASLGNETVSGRMKIVIGLLSVAAAVLASLQTFLGLAQRADQHKSAGTRYGALARALEILKTFPPPDPAELKRIVTDIQREMDRLAESAPGVSARLKREIDEELKNRAEKHIFHLSASVVEGRNLSESPTG